MEWADEVHRGVPGQTSRTAAIFRSEDPHERVWGVAYEISQDYWDRVLEEKVGYRERGGYNTDDVEFVQFDPNAQTVKDKIIVTLFLGDKASPNYKPGTIDELAKQIVRSVGASGTNLEYLYQTAESVRMILPPGETDKHLFELEAACKALEKKEAQGFTLKTGTVYLDEKYEQRRAMLIKVFKTVDKNMDRQMGLTEFQNLAKTKLNLNTSMESIKKKFDEIDVDKNGKLSTREFIEYFLSQLQDEEKKFKEEFSKFGIKNQNCNNFEHALLLYETMDGMKSNTASEMSLKELLEENKEIVQKMRIRTRPKAREVLEFFFPETIGDAMQLWFGKCSVNDENIKNRFSSLTKQALRGELDDWINSATDCLALVIVLTQFTRSIYRGTPQMFEGDSKALGVTMLAIFHGYTKALTPLQNIFLPCVTLSTQENKHCHELAVQIWVNYISPKLPAEDPLRIIQKNFKNNLDIMNKFGRFPHRNELLGRESTPEEAEFLSAIKAHSSTDVVFNEDGTVERSDEDGDKGLDNAISAMLVNKF
eukprot:GFUD01018810.1.p1 GENE.GFUD01018810.1~~GFUD01018810.1.p1  ORF type:complete len:603 (-),score=205.48 GFUD01018810.1:142-1752(-)